MHVSCKFEVGRRAQAQPPADQLRQNIGQHPQILIADDDAAGSVHLLVPLHIQGLLHHLQTGTADKVQKRSRQGLTPGREDSGQGTPHLHVQLDREADVPDRRQPPGTILPLVPVGEGGGQ